MGEETSLHRQLGITYYEIGEYEKAMRHLKEGLALAEDIGDKCYEGTAYQNLGACYQSLGQYDKAMSSFHVGLKIAKEIGNQSDAGQAYRNIGVCYKYLCQYDEAILPSQWGLEIAKKLGEKSGEAAAYQNLGVCYQSLGQYNNAILHLQKGLEIAEETGDNRLEVAAYISLGASNRSVGQYEKAISYLQQGLEIANEIGDKRGEGAAYHNLGVCYHCLGQYDNAISHLQESLKIANDIGDKTAEGGAYHHLGVCYRYLGQFDKATSLSERGMEIAKEIGEKGCEGAAYRNLGVCYYCLGQYDNAISHLQGSLKIAKEIGEKSGEGAAYQIFGACYQSLGQYDNAISHLKQGLEIAKEIGDKSAEGAAYRNLGVCYKSLGQCDHAISHLKQGLEIAKEIGDKSGEGAADGNLGVCYKSLGQYDTAIPCLEEGLKIAREIGSKNTEGPAHLNLGACYRSLGQFDKAIYHLQRGLNVAKKIGDKSAEWKAYHNLGATFKYLHDTKNAEHMLRKSVTCFIELFHNAPNLDADRVSFIDTFVDTSDPLIGSLVRQGKTDEALIVAEECRAMSLKYLMNSGNFVPNLSHPDQLNLQQIREMRKSLDRGGVMYFALPHGKICTWIIDENGQILRLFKTKVGEELEKVNFLKIPVSHLIKLALREVKVGCDDSSLTEKKTTGAKLQRIFQADAKLVLRVLVMILFPLMEPQNKAQVKCDDRSLSFLHPEVPRPTEEECECVPPRMDTLSTHICHSSRFAGAERSPISPGAEHLQQQGTPEMATDDRNQVTRTEIAEQLMRDLLAFLYKLLLYPVRQHIAGSQVVIVPDGPLALVPFAALVDENGRYVAESGARIRLVPSLAAGHIISKRPRNPIRTALIIGDPHVHKIVKDGKIIPVPRMPSAVKEAQLIGRVLRCKPLTGRKATKEEFLRNVESADLIHIAAHGDAERGEILLAAPSGTGEDQAIPVDEVMLKMSDLETRRIRAQLVVLSSCYSARGKVQGEGVVGMARAFLGAGARAVLVALWAVDDDVTYPMIGIFYEGLLLGKSASEALSDAMKVVRESQDRFRHPRFWAPFILLGDDVSPLGEEGCNIHTIRS